jgi:hypothetical protein
VSRANENILATQIAKCGYASQRFPRSTTLRGNATQLHDEALQTLAMGIRMCRGGIAVQSVFKFELDEQVELVPVQNAAADGTIEEMAEQHEPFERIARAIESEALGIRRKDERAQLMLGRFKCRAFDAPRDGKSQIVPARLKLPGIEKAKQRLQDVLRSVFGRKLRITAEHRTHSGVHVGKKREKDDAFRGSIVEGPFRLQ